MDLDRSPLAIYRSIFPDDKKFPYTRDRIGQITRHRSSLDGSLFFDYVLREIARIEDGKLFNSLIFPLGLIPQL